MKVAVSCHDCGEVRLLEPYEVERNTSGLCRACFMVREKSRRVVTPEKRSANHVLEAVKVLVEADWVPLKRLEFENLMNKLERLERENEDLRAREDGKWTPR